MYLIEHCVYEHNRAQRRLVYEMYVTDRLKAINESLASFCGGSTTKKRYVEMIEELKNAPEPERTAEEVISSISDKLERIGKNESV